MENENKIVCGKDGCNGCKEDYKFTMENGGYTDENIYNNVFVEKLQENRRKSTEYQKKNIDDKLCLVHRTDIWFYHLDRIKESQNILNGDILKYAESILIPGIIKF